MPPKAKAARKGSAPATRRLAEEFPPGEVLTDTGRRSWKLGAPVGRGGFGLIYLADQNSDGPVGSDAPYVVKVEPSDNGPLFSELHFYMRAAKPELIQNWIKTRKLKHLGVPRYWGSGLHERGGKRYRFMVIDRLGTDLQKKFEECGRSFSRKLVLQLGLRLLDVLEFIHEHEYVHADIKASNLMLSRRDPDQVYLLDYGLAYRYAPDGVHKDYKEDPKRCHDGTIEFTSVDAHRGAAASRRGDLEILSYCLVQWLCGRLPWEDRLQDAAYVRDAKIRCQENVPEFLSSCFPPGDRPGEIQSFMEEVRSLDYQDKPPYQRLRCILQAGLKSIRAADDGRLEFTPPPRPTKTVKRKKAQEEVEEVEESELEGSPEKKPRVSKRKEANGVKSSPRGPQRARKGRPRSRGVDAGTQTSPGLVRTTRSRRRAQT